MERRRAKRFTVVDLELFNQQTRSLIGTVVNISKGGLLAKTDVSFTPGDKYNFFIPFAKSVNGEVQFNFSALIVWCHPNSLHPKKFSVGIEFNNFPEVQTLFIQQMVGIFGGTK